MKRLIECPTCVGTGEEFFKGKIVRVCGTCKGEGVIYSKHGTPYKHSDE